MPERSETLGQHAARREELHAMAEGFAVHHLGDDVHQHDGERGEACHVEFHVPEYAAIGRLPQRGEQQDRHQRGREILGKERNPDQDAAQEPIAPAVVARRRQGVIDGARPQRNLEADRC